MELFDLDVMINSADIVDVMVQEIDRRGRRIDKYFLGFNIMLSLTVLYMFLTSIVRTIISNEWSGIGFLGVGKLLTNDNITGKI